MTPINQKKINFRKQAAIDDNSFNLILIVIAAILVLLLITAVYFIAVGVSSPNTQEGKQPNNNVEASTTYDYPFRTDIRITIPEASDKTSEIKKKTDTSDGIYSEFATLVDVTTGEVVASRLSKREIFPASMTKVMTLIVVFENLKSEDSLNDKITVTQEMYDTKITEQLSGDLYTVGEVLTVKDMIYALMLKSDGIAALGLAEYIAGSEKAFVQLMNEKADEMGLSKTNFTNCTGIHHDTHITTCQEMAAIMMYAMKNPFCAEVMSAASYRTTTNVYTDGITFYHGLLVTKLENEMPYLNLKNVTVTAGKTGWTGIDSGRCLVSFAEGENGHKYVLVTAKAPNKNEEVLDLEYIYNNFVK